MAVLAIKTEPKCKLCTHPNRPEVDALIERRSNREELEDGTRVNLEYVLARFRELGVDNPTEENIKNHWQKHCQKTTSGTVIATQDAAAEKLLAIMRGDIVVDVNADLDRLWAIGLAEIEARLSRGEKSGITPDVLLRVAQEKTRRAHNETQSELLTALTGGIAGALSGRAAARQISDASVVDAEAVEVP